jgi:hypothetical protein
VRSFEGANCGDLPPFVADKYFDCNVQREPLKAMVAKAICDRCVVRDECREEALNMIYLPKRGVIGGVTAAEVHAARSWRNYEQGMSDSVPRSRRPEWLPMTDATHFVEQVRVELDPDEPPDSP